MTRRAFIKRGMAAMSTLAVGETIPLHPADVQAQFWRSKRVSRSARPSAAAENRAARGD